MSKPVMHSFAKDGDVNEDHAEYDPRSGITGTSSRSLFALFTAEDGDYEACPDCAASLKAGAT